MMAANGSRRSYNHHQTGPAGAVFSRRRPAIPSTTTSTRLVVLGIDTVGRRFTPRLAAEGKLGGDALGDQLLDLVQRRHPHHLYFHNQIGILTETIGNPTPEIPFVLDTLPRADVLN
jgi:hypothetical protein